MVEVISEIKINIIQNTETKSSKSIIHMKKPCKEDIALLLIEMEIIKNSLLKRVQQHVTEITKEENMENGN